MAQRDGFKQEIARLQKREQRLSALFYTANAALVHGAHSNVGAHAARASAPASPAVAATDNANNGNVHEPAPDHAAARHANQWSPIQPIS